MLLEFSVENYLSIKDRITLSLRAGMSKELSETHMFESKGIDLLHSAVLYGANASGKSNVLKAMSFMKHMVEEFSNKSASQDQVPVENFKLSTETETEPSLFELSFIANGSIYRYGFEVDNEKVHSEWLFTIAKVKEVALFIREGQAIEVKKRFVEGKGLEKKTRENALFLSVVDQFNGEISGRIMKWFNSFVFIGGIDDKNLVGYTISHLHKEYMKKAVSKLLKVADSGIHEIKTEQETFKFSKLPDDLPKDMPEEARLKFMEMLEEVEQESKAGKDIKLHASAISMDIMHIKYDANNKALDSVPFGLTRHESEGTKKMFGMSGPIIDVLQKGKVLIVDELDARLHPLLTRAIVDLFHTPATNPKNAQIIFATHDTQLLVNERFRRDQIWFTEKDEYGATNLYSLLEYKVRSDASYGKDYISGKYGAIPFIGDFSQIFSEVE